MKDDDEFNVENLRLPADFALLSKPAGTAKPRRCPREFVMVSRRQLAALRQGRASATIWSVFIELVWLSWKENGKPVRFSRQTMRELGISPDSGVRAVRALANLGLISFSQPTVRSSLVITVHKP